MSSSPTPNGASTDATTTKNQWWHWRPCFLCCCCWCCWWLLCEIPLITLSYPAIMIMPKHTRRRRRQQQWGRSRTEHNSSMSSVSSFPAKPPRTTRRRRLRFDARDEHEAKRKVEIQLDRNVDAHLTDGGGDWQGSVSMQAEADNHSCNPSNKESNWWFRSTGSVAGVSPEARSDFHPGNNCTKSLIDRP